MAQPYVALPDVYRFRYKKQSGEDSTDVWFNEYDIKYPAGVHPATGDQIVQDLLHYEQSLHYGDVHIVGVDISDYHVGPSIGQVTFSLFVPIAGATGNQPAAASSLAGQGGGPIGGEVCLVVDKFIANQRRGGRNFYRGCLQKNDVGAESGGEWQIINNPQFPNQFAAHSLPAVAPYIAGGAGPEQWVLVHTQRTAQVPHVIVGFSFTPINSISLLMTPTTNKISRKSKR